MKVPFTGRLFSFFFRTSTFQPGSIAKDVAAIVPAYSSVYVVAAGGGTYFLIDSGTDPTGRDIIRFINSDTTGIPTSAVKAIFLTHHHRDHIAALQQFPDADIYIGAADRRGLEAKKKLDGFLPSINSPLRRPPVDDVRQIQTIYHNQRLKIGNKRVHAFALPGHTRGSMAYLVDHTLFVGDSLVFDPSGKAKLLPTMFSHNTKLARHSLRGLVKLLKSENLTPVIIAPSHSNIGSFDAMQEMLRKR